MQEKNIMECLFERIQEISNFRRSDEILKHYGKITNQTDDALNLIFLNVISDNDCSI